MFVATKILNMWSVSQTFFARDIPKRRLCRGSWGQNLDSISISRMRWKLFASFKANFPATTPTRHDSRRSEAGKRHRANPQMCSRCYWRIFPILTALPVQRLIVFCSGRCLVHLCLCGGNDTDVPQNEQEVLVPSSFFFCSFLLLLGGVSSVIRKEWPKNRAKDR